jgi:hypothetical protein
LLELIGHTGSVNAVAVTPDGTRIVTGAAETKAVVDRDQTGAPTGVARIWDATTGTALLEIKGHTKAILSVAIPDGIRIVTGSSDGSWRLWDATQLRPPPRQVQTSQARSAIVVDAKAVVSRCLTIDERKTHLLTPRPPAWCIDMNKDPYNTKIWKDMRVENWKALQAEKALNEVDSEIAGEYGDYGDRALKAGLDQVALEASNLGIKFDPGKTWIRVNLAHAYMFLGDETKALDEYLAGVGTSLLLKSKKKRWEDAVVEDFQVLRKHGREHELMAKVEQEFKRLSANRK